MPKTKKSTGRRRTVWLPSSLDQKAEVTRKKLGLGLSGFYRFAIIETIKDMEKGVKQHDEQV
jgi:hypothetical protein